MVCVYLEEYLEGELSYLGTAYRDEVHKVTNGVPGSHQQRVKTKAIAYSFFKKALLGGRVEVLE